jgi:N-acetylmuramoyl-L-alanine amidase
MVMEAAAGRRNRTRLRRRPNTGRVGAQFMKVAVVLLLWLAGLAGAAPAPLSQLTRVNVGSSEYVRLADWGRLNGFQSSWLSRQDLRLTNGTTRLGFTVNSQRISVNGVNLFLSAPIVLQNTAACITPLDLQATVQPLLWPARRASNRATLICLDPGHGGKDTGNREAGHLEKDYTLGLARELAGQLRKAGYKVFLTRSWDTFVELDERVEIARQRGAHLFISLHFNAAGNSEANGAEVYCLTPPHTASTNARGEGSNTGTLPGNLQNEGNLQLAYQLQRSLVTRLGLEDRGVRRARWAVLRPAHMPAVLVECGFMSNPSDLKRIGSGAWRRQLASALVDGVKNSQRLTTPAP